MSEIPVIEEEAPQCARCLSTSVQKRGRHYNRRKHAMVQEYECMKCGTFFTAGTYLRLGAPKSTIDYALSLASRGYTNVEITKKVEQKTGQKVTHGTIQGWIKRLGTGIHRNHGYARTRALAAAIRTLVGVEALAREMSVSPTAVEKMLANIEAYTKVRPVVKLKLQMNMSRRIANDLERTARHARRVADDLARKQAKTKKRTGD